MIAYRGPSAGAPALCGENPTSIRCSVGFTCTAYEATRGPKYPVATHQKGGPPRMTKRPADGDPTIGTKFFCRFTEVDHRSLDCQGLVYCGPPIAGGEGDKRDLMVFKRLATFSGFVI
jgi:hypothetical protein